MFSLVTIILLVESAATVNQSWVYHLTPNHAAETSTASHLAVGHDGSLRVTGRRQRGTSAEFTSVTLDTDGNSKSTLALKTKFTGGLYPSRIHPHVDGYVVCGSAGFANSDFITARLNRKGQLRWADRFNGPGDDRDVIGAVTTDSEGNIYVAAETESQFGRSDIITLKYDPAGERVWSVRTDHSRNDQPMDICVDAHGDVYVTGETKSGLLQSDFVTVKYSADGDQEWLATYNGPSNRRDEAVALALDAAGNVYVTGESNTSASSSRCVVVSYDASGDERWATHLTDNAAQQTEPRDIFADQHGIVVIVTLNLEDADASSGDLGVAKLSFDGQPAWLRVYNGESAGRDTANAAAIDNEGNIYAVGTSRGRDSRDIVVIKYNVDGRKSWVTRFDGPAGGDDFAKDIVVHQTDVYVTGSATVDSRPTFTAIKYEQQRP